MARPLLIGVFWILVECAFGQAPSSFVRFYGKVLKEKDSSAVQASLMYEKLPYYDDLGTGRSDESGNFEFYLADGNSYNFKITHQGETVFEEEIAISKVPGSEELKQNFYIATALDLILLDDLIFDRASDVISEVSHKELDDLAVWINSHQSMVIQLEGHTDFAGNADANMRLSEARVIAVKEYLVKKGVKKENVLTKAFGGTSPLYTDRTEDAKAANRRVEVRIISKN